MVSWRIKAQFLLLPLLYCVQIMDTFDNPVLFWKRRQCFPALQECQRLVGVCWVLSCCEGEMSICVDSGRDIEVCIMSIATMRSSTNIASHFIPSEGTLEEETKVHFLLASWDLWLFLSVLWLFLGRLETVQELLPKYFPKYSCDVLGSLTYCCILSASQDMPNWRHTINPWIRTVWVTGMHAAKPGLTFMAPV